MIETHHLKSLYFYPYSIYYIMNQKYSKKSNKDKEKDKNVTFVLAFLKELEFLQYFYLQLTFIDFKRTCLYVLMVTNILIQHIYKKIMNSVGLRKK